MDRSVAVALCWLASFGPAACAAPEPSPDAARPVLAELPADEREPWILQVPEGTRTHAFRPATDNERASAPEILLVEDLVISEATVGSAAQFGERTPRLDLDDAGNIYVADASNARVQLFDADGNYLRTIGRAGQGPGEFQLAMVPVIAGGALFVSDTARARLAKFTLDGEVVWDKQTGVFPGYLIAPQIGLPDGSWLIRFHLPRTSDEVVTRMSPDGQFLSGDGGPSDSSDKATVSRMSQLTKVTFPERVWYPPRPPGASPAGQYAFYVGRTRPTFAFQPSGETIVSKYEEYQLMAVSPDGEARWALQVAQPPVPLTDAEKQWGTQRMRDQAYPEAKTDEFEWPEHQFDLGDVRVDARGRIYAFPYVPRGVTRERFVVDVFNAQGQPIFAGWMGLRAAGPDGGGAVLPMSSLAWPGVWKFGPMLETAWQVSEGNAIYGLVINPDTEEWEVRRWRIVWPD